MYSSPRWSLPAIKWWGDWAKGESGNAVYKYLLEEYSKIEDDYSDMLSPFRKDRNIASIDESIEEQPVNKRQFEAAFSQLNDRLDAIGTALESVGRFAPSEVARNDNTTLSSVPLRTMPIPLRTRRQRTEDAASVIVPEASIAIPKVFTWEDCLRQWNEGDLANGLKPLKLWTSDDRKPKSYLKDKENNSNKAIHSVRKLLGDEYETLGDNAFRDAYSEYLGEKRNLNSLYTEIRRQKLIRKTETDEQMRTESRKGART